ncbi:hypothetical protein [Streptomyces sp. NPDC047028]|uniref:ISAzo13-like element transposase-related protein n=1 Tax=Streptomyces sp. NPDC047028 TaxID=3155793 RepID=UPI0034021DAB
MFAPISINLRGRPVTSHEAVVSTIGATTTRIGLTVRAERDSGAHPDRTTVPTTSWDRLPLEPHEWHGIRSRRGPEQLRPEPPCPSPESDRFPAGTRAPAGLLHHSRGGMEPTAGILCSAATATTWTSNPPIMATKRTGPGSEWPASLAALGRQRL